MTEYETAFDAAKLTVVMTDPVSTSAKDGAVVHTGRATTDKVKVRSENTETDVVEKARTVNVNVPVVGGVPLSAPVLDSEQDPGSAPDPGASAYDADSAFVADKAELNATSADVFGRDPGVVHVGTVATRSVKDLSEYTLTEFVLKARTVNAKVPAAVGVPVSRPADDREMPAGSAPEETAYDVDAVADK